MDKKTELNLIKNPLGDDDINFYLPNTKIIKYSDLKNVKNIEDLLPNNKSNVVILYEINGINDGHWVAIMRYKDHKRGDIIEFFDSIADDGSPDSELKWISKSKNKMFGQSKPYLTNLLNKSVLPVIFNKLKFQSDGNKKDGYLINTCGKHIVFRILNLLDKDLNLEDYQKLLKDVKKDSGNTFDEIVSHLILDHYKK